MRPMSNYSTLSNFRLCLGVTGIASLVGLTIGFALYFNGCLDQAYYITMVSGMLLLLTVISASLTLRCIIRRNREASSQNRAVEDPAVVDSPPPYQKRWAKEYSHRQRKSPKVNNTDTQQQEFSIHKQVINSEKDSKEEIFDDSLPKYEIAIRELSAVELANVYAISTSDLVPENQLGVDVSMPNEYIGNPEDRNALYEQRTILTQSENLDNSKLKMSIALVHWPHH